MNIPVLASAFNALSPVPASLVEACGILNAQTTPAVPVDVPATVVRDLLTQTGEWGALLVAIDPGTTAPNQIRAIIHNLKTLVDTNGVFKTSNQTVQSAVKSSLTALNSAGFISSGTVTACEALWTGAPQPVRYPEAVIPAHLQMAQRAGLISTAIPVS